MSSEHPLTSPVFFRPVVTGESHLILGRNLRVAPLADDSEDLTHILDELWATQRRAKLCGLL